MMARFQSTYKTRVCSVDFFHRSAQFRLRPASGMSRAMVPLPLLLLAAAHCCAALNIAGLEVPHAQLSPTSRALDRYEWPEKFPYSKKDLTPDWDGNDQYKPRSNLCNAPHNATMQCATQCRHAVHHAVHHGMHRAGCFTRCPSSATTRATSAAPRLRASMSARYHRRARETCSTCAARSPRTFQRAGAHGLVRVRVRARAQPTLT